MIGSQGNLRSSFTFRLLGFRESLAAIINLYSNRQAIELKAPGKYLDGETEPDGSVLIRTTDL
jgi:hypothetical protein